MTINILDTADYYSLLEYGNTIEKSWNNLEVGVINIDTTRFILAIRALQKYDFEYLNKMLNLLKQNKSEHHLCLDKLERLAKIRYRC